MSVGDSVPILWNQRHRHGLRRCLFQPPNHQKSLLQNPWQGNSTFLRDKELVIAYSSLVGHQNSEEELALALWTPVGKLLVTIFYHIFQNNLKGTRVAKRWLYLKRWKCLLFWFGHYTLYMWIKSLYWTPCRCTKVMSQKENKIINKQTIRGYGRMRGSEDKRVP